MAHAEICPVCAGKGMIRTVSTSSVMPDTTCHGCNGKGWVTVGVARKDNLTSEPVIKVKPLSKFPIHGRD